MKPSTNLACAASTFGPVSLVDDASREPACHDGSEHGPPGTGSGDPGDDNRLPRRRP